MSATTTGRKSFYQRLWDKIAVATADLCWEFKAARTRGGRREVDYGAIWIDGRSWRANRVVLILHTAPLDFPRFDGEDFLVWFKRAAEMYAHFDAAHSCDNSRCCNPYHLKWEDHRTNVSNQFRRRRVPEIGVCDIGAATLLDSSRDEMSA